MQETLSGFVCVACFCQESINHTHTKAFSVQPHLVESLRRDTHFHQRTNRKSGARGAALGATGGFRWIWILLLVVR